jgi:hypothetical protein
MSKEKERFLIGQKEAAALLGLKTTNRVALLIKEGILNTYEKEGSQRRWLDYDEVFNLPKKLPRPLPDEYFPKLKVNERWEKNKKDK